nr:MAG TPA_asm: hypothetical protein [Caudoviricetes sp.]
MATPKQINFIKIGNVALPPCKRGVNITVTTVVNNGRNTNGAVVGQKVGRDQYKIDNLEWAWLTAEQWESVLSVMKSFYFNVTFPDPVTGRMIKLKMYCGDRSAEPYWLDKNNTKPTHYTNCKVNLIDTGKGKKQYASS